MKEKNIDNFYIGNLNLLQKLRKDNGNIEYFNLLQEQILMKSDALK